MNTDQSLLVGESDLSSLDITSQHSELQSGPDLHLRQIIPEYQPFCSLKHAVLPTAVSALLEVSNILESSWTTKY
jgi:hypothetical protein